MLSGRTEKLNQGDEWGATVPGRELDPESCLTIYRVNN